MDVIDGLNLLVQRHGGDGPWAGPGRQPGGLSGPEISRGLGQHRRHQVRGRDYFIPWLIHHPILVYTLISHRNIFNNFVDKDQECFLSVKKHNLDLIFVFLPALGCGRCAPGCTERRMRPAARRTSCSWRLPRPSRRPRGSAWWPKLSALPNR